MSELFGNTRTVVKSRYALITPDGFVPSVVPGWKNAVVIVNISPVMAGPRFTQMHVTLAADGAADLNTCKRELFLFVIEGVVTLHAAGKHQKLEAGGYIYLPPNSGLRLTSEAANTRLLTFEKEFAPSAKATSPTIIIGHERDVKGEPFLGNEDARLQVLLPDKPEFDMAVNIFTYQSGATLPFVETHIMEHGLLMLKGQGVYRLDQDYHPVKAGDIIWMASYCP